MQMWVLAFELQNSCDFEKSVVMHHQSFDIVFLIKLLKTKWNAVFLLKSKRLAQWQTCQQIYWLTKQLIGLTRSWLTACVSETDWVNDLNKQQLNNNFFKFLYSLLLNNKIIEIMNKNRVTYSLQLADQPTDLLMDWLTVS